MLFIRYSQEKHEEDKIIIGNRMKKYLTNELV